MERKIVYPLDQVLSVKQKRLEEAEREVSKRKKALEEEEKRLEKCNKERQKVLDHYNEKKAQLIEKLDTGTTPNEIKWINRYLDVVKDKLTEEDKKVNAQKEQVDRANMELQKAKSMWKQRFKELEKMETHKEHWLKDAKMELHKEITKEQDELGSIMFISKRARGN
ncbi:type III secretion T3S chaperone [Chlamydiia bacterium]|jgi:flagellar export protein FliJ|nr:type III secretion T3S chaperone [Chlamydiia bacterium]